MKFSLGKRAMMAGMYIGPALIGILIGAGLAYFLFYKGWIPCPSVGGE